MTMYQFIGAAALAVGVILLVLAYQSTNAPIEQLSDAFAGPYSNETIWYRILGIVVAFVGGGFLATFGGRD